MLHAWTDSVMSEHTALVIKIFRQFDLEEAMVGEHSSYYLVIIQILHIFKIKFCNCRKTCVFLWLVLPTSTIHQTEKSKKQTTRIILQLTLCMLNVLQFSFAFSLFFWKIAIKDWLILIEHHLRTALMAPQVTLLFSFTYLAFKETMDFSTSNQ